MEIKRKVHLRQGLLLAAVPAVLFLPAVALLTVCPPEYGIAIMRATAVVFAADEIFAGWRLLGVLERKLDGRSVAAIGGLLLALLMLVAIAWGFVAPSFARRAGY
jgi:hypothetical protein